MNEKLNKVMLETVTDQKSANALIGRLFDLTKPEAVFSQPVTVGEHTIITASEYVAGMGVGYGSGGGLDPNAEGEGGGFGGGGGGGGSTMARPVATIIIGPNGVQVEPVVDVSKIAVTMFTALGTMALALRKMKSG